MSKKVRSKEATLKLGGRIVTVVSIAGFAEMVGKSVHTLKEYERKDVLPNAPIINGNIRYYPVELVKAVKPIIEGFPLNKAPNTEDLIMIIKLFNEERSKYA